MHPAPADLSKALQPQSADTNEAAFHYSSLIAFFHNEEEAALAHMFEGSHAIFLLPHVAQIDF